MKPKVSSKLLILFGLICGIFFYAESGFCANVYSRNASEDLESIEDKSSSFSAKLNQTKSATSAESESALAQKIRAQRAALDAKDKQSATAQKTKSGATKNNCDTDLRKCIASKCGSEYAKCETDSDTTFSDKLNACKKEANCTAREFTLFTNEIKADKNQTISLSLYNKVISCGNAYNDCIITECGKKFNKCLSKSAGDKAIAKCKNIATECTEADSGMVGRIGNIFGIVRQDAEKQIKADEQKLYSLRKQMKDSCSMLGSGAMFDERSLDCVFTVNFFAGDDKKTPKASKKLYAGSTFNCSPDWFGIDVTTFKENAYRATRAQTAASSAMLGSGVGMAVGALTSGAISRAIDTKKAKDALEDACAEENMIIKDDKCFCDAGDKTGLVKQGDKCVCKDATKTYNKKSGKCENGTGTSADTSSTKGSDQKPSASGTDPKDLCEKSELAGQYANGKCDCSKHGDGVKEEGGKCVKVSSSPGTKPASTPDGQSADAPGKDCTDSGGDWNEESKECKCDRAKELEQSSDKSRCKQTLAAMQRENEEASKKVNCEQSAIPGKYINGKCDCSNNGADVTEENGKCVKLEIPSSPLPAPTLNTAFIDQENQKYIDACTTSGGDWNEKKGKCSCNKKKGLTDDVKGYTCKCSMNGYTYSEQSNKCVNAKQANNDAARAKCENSGGWQSVTGSCNCDRSKLLQPNQDDTECQCWEPYEKDTIAYFDATKKRCYFTNEALEKYCKRDIRIVAPEADKDAVVGTSPEHGCLCPPPYENYSETHPALLCL